MIRLSLAIIFWTCIAASASHAVYLARSGRFTMWPGWGTAVTATGLCVLVVGTDLFFAFVVPFSIMQDIVAAQEGLRGHALPSMHINSLVKVALAEQTNPNRFTAFWPALANEVDKDYNRVPKVISEEAHPPFFVLLISPAVYLLGVRGTSLAMAGLSMGSFAIMLWLLRSGLNFDVKPDRALLITVLLLAWDPMSWVLRAGQLGAILGALIVIAWFCIRTERPLLAGAAVALATSIKIFPGLLLLYFLLRHRRALLSALVTIAALNLVAMAIWGKQAYLDWAQTMNVVTKIYWASPDNWSLLGFLGRLQWRVPIAASIGRIAFVPVSLIVVGALCWAVSRSRAKGSAAAQCDLEYALFVAAMPLLCPLCWSHYFVILLLPLAVLAKRVWQKGSDFVQTSSLFVLFVVLSASGLIATAYNEGPRITHWLEVLPTLALVGVLSWNILLVLRNDSLWRVRFATG